MSFYNDPEKVDQYIAMCDGYDGSNLYRELRLYLPDRKSVLELGSGPGFDLAFLKEHYRVTGSDLSDEFLTRLKKKYPAIPFRKVDATMMALDETFDCIYSNKVLHHLTAEELSASLLNQAKRLTPGGLIAHSFWIGEESHEMEGMLFTYYRQEELLELISRQYDVISTLGYQEFEPGDSLFVIARLK